MKPRVTAILNLKGGVAKTTTAINMAAILGRDGKEVLLIDADSQCNATEFCGGHPEKGNLAKLLRYGNQLRGGEQAYCKLQIQPTHFAGVDILPGDDSLMDLDLSKVEAGAVNTDVLRTLVEAVADQYDYVLIDCPPAFNAACAAALIAAQDVVIPIKLDAFSLRGMVNLLRQISNMHKINPKLTVAGMLPTMWYRNPKIREAEDQLRAADLPVYHYIRRSDKVDDSTFAQAPLLISSPHSAAGVDYRKFVKEYVEGIR